MNKSDFKKLTGYVDYDRNDLPKLNKSQKIQYFYNKRVKKLILNPLREMYTSIMKQKKNCSPLLCFGNCICCSMEAFGKFYTARTQTGFSGKNFKDFIKKYMDNEFFTGTFNGKRFVDLLWDDFRNGIAHGFVIKSGGFEHNQPKYFQIKNIKGKNELEIDLKHFYKDFLDGIKKYINDLRKSRITDPIFKNFDKTFIDLYIKGK
jgi:hypothetical protein